MERIKPLYMLFPEHLLPHARELPLPAGFELRVYRDEDAPALKTYLKLRFVPFLYAPEMKERWHAVHVQLNLPSRSHEWIEPKQKKIPIQEAHNV